MKTVCVFHIWSNGRNSQRKFLNLKKSVEEEQSRSCGLPCAALAPGAGCQECISGVTRRDCRSSSGGRTEAAMPRCAVPAWVRVSVDCWRRLLAATAGYESEHCVRQLRAANQSTPSGCGRRLQAATAGGECGRRLRAASAGGACGQRLR
jgi:hypothetical protein